MDESYTPSPTKSVYAVNTDHTHEEYAKRLVDRAEASLSSSLPSSSLLKVAGQGLVAFRPSSELGHYADIDRRGVRTTQELSTDSGLGPGRLDETGSITLA